MDAIVRLRPVARAVFRKEDGGWRLQLLAVPGLKEVTLPGQNQENTFIDGELTVFEVARVLKPIVKGRGLWYPVMDMVDLPSTFDLYERAPS